MDVADSTIIPDTQHILEWCILCPRNKYLRDNTFAHNHYLRVHHKKLHVVNDFKMLSCKCSEIRSHGYDRSAHNLHFHCYLCFYPFKVGDLLATHLITHHTEIRSCEVRHLMRPDNPHRNYDLWIHLNIREKTSVFLCRNKHWLLYIYDTFVYFTWNMSQCIYFKCKQVHLNHICMHFYMHHLLVWFYYNCF